MPFFPLKKSIILFGLISLIFVFFILIPTHFAALPLEPVTIKPMASIISGLINGLLALAAGIAILFLIAGGIRYTRSWGDSGEMEKAKKMVIYVVLGLVIILVSYSIVITLDKIINDGSGGAVSINSTSVTPLSGPIGTVFTIKATVTAVAGVDDATVIAHIQLPDETDITTITLSPIGGGVYSSTWIATANGPYFVDITACDLSANCREVENI